MLTRLNGGEQLPHLRGVRCRRALSRQPELEQAAQAALIGVHLDKSENGLLIQGGVRLKSKPEIAQIGGHG